MQTEQQLVRLMLDKEFYDANRHRVVREMFPDALGTIYDTLVEGHERYNRSLTLDELRALHRTQHPTLTRAARNSIEELFVDIELVDPMGEDVAKDVLAAMWKKEQGRRIAEIGIAIMDGKEQTLTPLIDLVARTGDDFVPVDEKEAIDTDVFAVLAALDNRQRWLFNLPTLQDKVPGIAEGELGVWMGRPEVGKTAGWLTFVAGPGGWLEQGAKVHVICNEEPAIRTLLRAISCFTSTNNDDVRANPAAIAPEWNRVRRNLTVRDDNDMTMEALDAYCKRHKPDIVILDQIDKIKTFGTFARDDQKYEYIYMMAREIAKRHNCAVFGICQASAEAEGKTKVTYSMAAHSKTGKAGEADLWFGVGALPTPDGVDADYTRYITASKNKVNGWHGTVTCKLVQEYSRYEP